MQGRHFVLLPWLLLALTDFRCYAAPSKSHRKFDQVNHARPNDGTTQPQNIRVHNVTVNCGDWVWLRYTVLACKRDLGLMGSQGFPWAVSDRLHSVTRGDSSLEDPLDSLDSLCETLDKSRRCLEENGISEYCSQTVAGAPANMEFEFICHRRQRDENLVRSLRCLHESRLLVMLYFHIANRCGGVEILDSVITRRKNTYFYSTDVNPVFYQTSAPLMYCLPRQITSTCVKQLVDDRCGAMSADLVQSYLFYIQDRYSETLQAAGLSAKTCDPDIGPSSNVENKTRTDSDIGKTKFSKLPRALRGPGTAMDSVYGNYLSASLISKSGEDICQVPNSYLKIEECVMYSDDVYNKRRFNILQFAHLMLPLAYHGAKCDRMEEFTACWNRLHTICGPKVRGLEQYAVLLVEGCKIQSEMDTAGCEWQDMLLPYYIQASQVTPWPLVNQCLKNPMLLETSVYARPSIIEDLKNLITVLQPGVKEISQKCGPRLATRLWFLLQRLSYLQYDALKYTNVAYVHI